MNHRKPITWPLYIQVTRLELTLKETRDELELTRQKYNAEIASLEDSLSQVERDLTIEREAAQQVSKELQAREEHIQVTMAECETLQEQLGQRIEEINVLEEQVRLMKLDINDRDKRESQSQNMVWSSEAVCQLTRFSVELSSQVRKYSCILMNQS